MQAQIDGTPNKGHMKVISYYEAGVEVRPSLIV
jgi:hypothetical protein